MRWTKSQQALMDLSRQPVKGCPLDIVYVEQDFSGVTTALRFLERRSHADKSMPYSVRLNGATAWDACCQLSKLTGSVGGSYLDRIWNAMAAIQRERPGCPVILWMEEAKLMRAAKREQLVVTIEHAAQALTLHVRTVFLVGKVSCWKQANEIWNGKQLTHGMRVRDFPAISDRLWSGRKGERRGEAMLYSEDGLSELRSGVLPGMEVEEEVRAVASA
jgi:hypothetical protein